MRSFTYAAMMLLVSVGRTQNNLHLMKATNTTQDNNELADQLAGKLVDKLFGFGSKATPSQALPAVRPMFPTSRSFGPRGPILRSPVHSGLCVPLPSPSVSVNSLNGIQNWKDPDERPDAEYTRGKLDGIPRTKLTMKQRTLESYGQEVWQKQDHPDKPELSWRARMKMKEANSREKVKAVLAEKWRISSPFPPQAVPANASGVAHAKYLKGSVDKTRRVIDLLPGRSYENALVLLQVMPYRCSGLLLKALQSAAANAVDKYGVNKADLYVTSALAMKGPSYKRFRPRAKGRFDRIEKKTQHVSIAVAALDEPLKPPLNPFSTTARRRRTSSPLYRSMGNKEKQRLAAARWADQPEDGGPSPSAIALRDAVDKYWTEHGLMTSGKQKRKYIKGTSETHPPFKVDWPNGDGPEVQPPKNR